MQLFFIFIKQHGFLLMIIFFQIILESVKL